jgi:N-acetylneuraminic acid mutarotase
MKTLALALVLVFLTASCIILAEPISGAFVVGNSWAKKTPVPTAGQYGAVVVNGEIYVMSGSSNYLYNPATDTWATKTPMLTPRSSFAITVCQNKIYAIGGHSNGSLNEVYDPLTDTWTTKAPMPTNRSQIKANTVDGKIYVICGKTGGPYSTLDSTDVYDPSTDSWTTKAAISNSVAPYKVYVPNTNNIWTTKSSLPYSVANYASAVVDNKIYVIGGQNEFGSTSNLNTVQIYDPATNNWTLGKPAPNFVWQAAAGATTGLAAPKRIYVAGGCAGFAMGSNQNYAYEPKDDVWVNASSMPTARYMPTMAVVNDLLYVIGGGQWMDSVAVNEQYTPMDYFGSTSSTSPSPSTPEFSSWIFLPIFITTIVAVAGAGLLVYFNKRVHKKS